jgi:hypothetical protein
MTPTVIRNAAVIALLSVTVVLLAIFLLFLAL